MGALPQIFSFAELIMSNRLHVLNGLLYNNCFRELNLDAFYVYCFGTLIWCYSFAKAKRMLIRVDVPDVLAFVLDSCSDVAVRFLVHFCDLLLLILRATCREE